MGAVVETQINEKPREPFTLPWTREERAEFALNPWRGLFTEPQFRAAVRQIAVQMECHVEKDLKAP